MIKTYKLGLGALITSAPNSFSFGEAWAVNGSVDHGQNIRCPGGPPTPLEGWRR
jgi:hypothetical protein